MKKGEKMSDEQKAKISKAHKGRVFTEEHIENLRKSHIGKMPTNLEQLRLYRKNRPLTEDHKRKIGLKHKGKIISEATRKKIGLAGRGRIPWNKGSGDKEYICCSCGKQFITNQKNRRFCNENCFHTSTRGENSPHWIENRDIVIGRHARSWHDPESKQWCRKVYERDNFKCRTPNQDCGKSIEAHHILRWKSYPELRYKVSNGITLCRYHHPKIRKKEDEMVDTFKKLIVN